MNIEFGKKYEDKVTGFIGTCIGYCQYITGCNQVLLAPKTDNPNKKPDGEWIDEQRLIVLNGEALVIDNGLNPGCDKPAPTI
jgi:hypothetical protein